MAPKTHAEVKKTYLERKSQSKGVTNAKIKKSRARIQNKYRGRKKKVNSEAFLKQERERKCAAYMPSILLPESALAKRRRRTEKRRED